MWHAEYTVEGELTRVEVANVVDAIGVIKFVNAHYPLVEKITVYEGGTPDRFGSGDFRYTTPIPPQK